MVGFRESGRAKKQGHSEICIVVDFAVNVVLATCLGPVQIKIVWQDELMNVMAEGNSGRDSAFM
jgi:hypothetical protein